MPEDISIDALVVTKMKRNKLTYFKTSNQFEVLSENHEKDFQKLIKRAEIVTAKKKSLKKCRTCNYKKRQCVLNPSMCTAINRICSYCKTVGHFPKSLCCQKRKKFQQKGRKLIDTPKSSDQNISKKNLKLINLRIKQLEFQIKKSNVINLAEKCAEKFRKSDISKEK